MGGQPAGPEEVPGSADTAYGELQGQGVDVTRL